MLKSSGLPSFCLYWETSAATAERRNSHQVSPHRVRGSLHSKHSIPAQISQTCCSSHAGTGNLVDFNKASARQRLTGSHKSICPCTPVYKLKPNTAREKKTPLYSSCTHTTHACCGCGMGGIPFKIPTTSHLLEEAEEVSS